MAGLDELMAEIPVQDIASKLGVDEGEVNTAIQTLVPALVGGLQHNVASTDIDSSTLESAVNTQAANGLLDGGASVDQVDQHEGNNIVANIFGGNDSGQVASALAGGGIGSSDLIKRLLPILAPIVLAYIGKQLTKGGASAPAPAGTQAAPAGGGGLGEILGSILAGAAGGGAAGGGAASGGNSPLGSILGSVLGGQNGAAIGNILGGLLGGKR